MACGLEAEETEQYGPVAFYTFDMEWFFKTTVRVCELRCFLLILGIFLYGQCLDVVMQDS